MAIRLDISTLLSSVAFLCATLPANAGAPLEAGTALRIEGTHGRFDFLAVDAPRRRLLAAHTGNSSLDVINLDERKLVKLVPTGAAQAPAVDQRRKTYYVTTSNPKQVVTVDAETLEPVGKVEVSGPADLVAVNPQTGLVYAGCDDGKDLWVIDPVRKSIAATVALPSDSPEDLAFDSTYGRLFQAMKTGGLIAVIDIATNSVSAQWPTAPATEPHGIAALPEEDVLLIAGSNGKLVMLSQKDGLRIASADIAKRVDQIAYDRDLHRVYCASGAGTISVVSVGKDSLTSLGDIPSAEGAHSIALDPKTHVVWIAYAKGDGSFVQPYTPEK